MALFARFRREDPTRRPRAGKTPSRPAPLRGPSRDLLHRPQPLHLGLRLGPHRGQLEGVHDRDLALARALLDEPIVLEAHERVRKLRGAAAAVDKVEFGKAPWSPREVAHEALGEAPRFVDEFVGEPQVGDFSPI